jgi:hypothetical protein
VLVDSLRKRGETGGRGPRAALFETGQSAQFLARGRLGLRVHDRRSVYGVLFTVDHDGGRRFGAIPVALPADSLDCPA